MTGKQEQYKIMQIEGLRTCVFSVARLAGYKFEEGRFQGRVQLTIIGSETGTHPQRAHSDETYPNNLDGVFQHFSAVPCVILFAIGQTAYLDIRPLSDDRGHRRVEIPRGRALILRGDCVHRGVENNGSLAIRLHAYCRPPNWVPTLTKGGGNFTFYAEEDFEFP